MTEANMQPGWVAADWGTSHLRLWLMDDAGQPLRRIDADCGMGRLGPDGFEPALLAQLAQVLPDQGTLPVICCGMAGSRQGWAEAPYAATPCAPPSLDAATRVATRDPRLSVFILPGIKQMQPADVMRGEETQIAGVLQQLPTFDGVICLPGTHTKWVRIAAGTVAEFRTFMTGELFALLSQHSVLRHSMTAEGWDTPSFATAIGEGAAAPGQIAAALFGLRAEALLHGLSPGCARARLSGLLIGLEIGSTRAIWQNTPVIIVGEDRLAALYEEGLGLHDVRTHLHNAEAATLAGLSAAYQTLSEIVT